MKNLKKQSLMKVETAYELMTDFRKRKAKDMRQATIVQVVAFILTALFPFGAVLVLVSDYVIGQPLYVQWTLWAAAFVVELMIIICLVLSLNQKNFYRNHSY